MVEMHCHLLPKIDDGVRTFDEAVNMIRKMQSFGYTDILITPHFINGTSYNKNNKEKYDLLLKLQEQLKNENINVNTYLGNEIFIDENILNDLKDGNCYTMNGSKYVLVEIPRNDVINGLDTILFRLRSKGLIPIMAHPERYMIVKQNKEVLDHWIDQGVLLQVNFDSIGGKYGKQAQKLVKYILKTNKATFIGGDMHHELDSYFENFEKNKRKIIKIVGEEKFNELAHINPLKIINKENIETN